VPCAAFLQALCRRGRERRVGQEGFSSKVRNVGGRVSTGPTRPARPYSHRLLRLELQIVARTFLSRGSSRGALAPLLHRHLRYRRDQQHLLSITGGLDVHRVAAADAFVISDGGEG